MTLENEKKILVERYTNQRKWQKITDSYGFWVYPHDYYMDLVDLVLKHTK